MIAALLVASVTALPASTGTYHSFNPDLKTEGLPFTILVEQSKRDPNTLVKFYIPGVGEVDSEDTEGLAKRDPNSLVKFYIPGVGKVDSEDAEDLTKRNSLVSFYIPSVDEVDEDTETETA